MVFEVQRGKSSQEILLLGLSFAIVIDLTRAQSHRQGRAIFGNSVKKKVLRNATHILTSLKSLFTWIFALELKDFFPFPAQQRKILTIKHQA